MRFVTSVTVADENGNSYQWTGQLFVVPDGVFAAANTEALLMAAHQAIEKHLLGLGKNEVPPAGTKELLVELGVLT